MLMNSQPVLEHAESFAERLQREAGDAPDAKIRRAWKLAFGRPPTGRELDESRSFLEKQRELMSGEDYQQRVEEVDPRRQALINFCQSLLSANEFLYVD